MLKIREPIFRTESTFRLSKLRDAVRRADKLFCLTVVLPTLVAILYFGFLASDVYISESQFVIRAPDKPAATALGVLLKSTGFSNAGDEVYAAEKYVGSRDALRALNNDGTVVRAYHNRNISLFDRFNPTGLRGTFEDLYRYYQSKVEIDFDTSSSVATLRVRAYTPGDAHRFNEQLLQLAENMVNRLNSRGRNDVVQFAEHEVKDAQLSARNAAVALAAFRNNHGVVDPEAQAKAQLDMVSKLQDELIGARIQLLQLQKIAPENPQIPVLTTRIDGLQHQIDVQTGRVAGDRRSLSETAVQYEQLELEREYSDKRLAAAMSSLQNAEDEAQRKQAYVERIEQPSVPDDSEEPHRLRGIISTLVVGLFAWGILKLLLGGIREHHGL